jgi:2-polyprenyl-3-methyl-5-hydroxy-6-metoxy-1,4-benzoquinol methylase
MTNDTRDTYNRIAHDWHKDHMNDTWSIDATESFSKMLPAGSCVLDVGCAGGLKSRVLVKNGLRVVGIDTSEAFIEIAKREVPEGDFRVMDMRDVSSLDGEFDGIFILASLLHIPKLDVHRALSGLTAKLKIGGYIYVAVKERRADQLEEEIVVENDYGYRYERFFSFYTIPELQADVESVGLQIQSIKNIPFGKTNWIHVVGLKK